MGTAIVIVLTVGLVWALDHLIATNDFERGWREYIPRHRK